MKNYKKILESKTVLLIEDHLESRELLASILEEYFGEVIVGENGFDSINNVKMYNPDLLITDIKMSGLDGISAIETIRSFHPKLPIIIISAFSDTEYLFKAANLNLQGYILKPLKLDLLENTILKIFSENILVDLSSDCLYDYNNSLIRYDGENILLAFKENEFLHILIKNKNTIVSYEFIENELWGKYGELMSIESLRGLVKKLRKKLPIDIIQNISKSGYKITL